MPRTPDRRGRYSPLLAVVAALLGLLLVPLGVALGVHATIRSGFTLSDAGGLVVLAVGLALAAVASRAAFVAVPGWWRLSLVPTAIVALLLVWSLTIGAMLALAPRTELGAATPSGRALAYTDVAFRTADGVRLSAWYLPSANHAVVVTIPGSGSTRIATLDQAVVLARHGYGVLMLDPRGQGRSGGRAMDAGWYGDRDIAAAVAFVRQRPGVDPNRVGLLGLSMGGEEAIGAAAAVPGVRAVVAEGATHRTAEDKAGFLPGGIAGAIQRALDRLTYATAAALSGAPRPPSLHSAVAQAAQTAFLLIAAGKAADEPQATAYLRTAAPQRVQTWVVPGATHTHGLQTAPAAWTARVTAFLDHALRSPVG